MLFGVLGLSQFISRAITMIDELVGLPARARRARNMAVVRQIDLKGDRS
jgi:hypothetical protein